MQTVAQFLQQIQTAASQKGAEKAWHETMSVFQSTYQDLYTQLHNKRGWLQRIFQRNPETFPLDWEHFLSEKKIDGTIEQVQIQLTEYLNQFMTPFKALSSSQKRWAQVTAMLTTVSLFFIKDASIPQNPADALLATLRQNMATLQAQLEQIKASALQIAQQRDQWAFAFQNKELLDRIRRDVVEIDDGLMLQYQLFSESAQVESPTDQEINKIVRALDARLRDLLANTVGLARVDVRVGMAYTPMVMEVLGLKPNQEPAREGTVAELLEWGYLIRPDPQAANASPIVYRRAKVRLYDKADA